MRRLIADSCRALIRGLMVPRRWEERAPIWPDPAAASDHRHPEQPIQAALIPPTMASGIAHDRATCLLALPCGLLCWPWWGSLAASVCSLSFLIGGLWLSPDLDIASRPSRRWGPLRLLWWPYRRYVPHRSPLSHAPLLGSAGRLAYLGVLLLLFCGLLQPLGAPSPQALLHSLADLWGSHRSLVLAGLVGLEASAWLHLIQDGDPMPRGLGRMRRRGRQQRQRRDQARSRQRR